MKCNCINRIEGDLAEHYADKAGEGATAKCGGTAWLIGREASTTLKIPFFVKGTKKGYTSAKGKEVNMIVSYCPWCGTKAQPDEVKTEIEVTP